MMINIIQMASIRALLLLAPYCITAAYVTQPHTCALIWRGCPTEVSTYNDEFSWHSALPTLCFTHCSPVNAILPNSRTLDGYPPPSKLVKNFILLALQRPAHLFQSGFFC